MASYRANEQLAIPEKRLRTWCTKVSRKLEELVQCAIKKEKLSPLARLLQQVPCGCTPNLKRQKLEHVAIRRPDVKNAMLKRRFTEFGGCRVHHGKASMGHDGREYIMTHGDVKLDLTARGDLQSYHQTNSERTATRNQMSIKSFFGKWQWMSVGNRQRY